MDPQSIFPAILMAAAALSALLMAWYAWRWRQAEGGACFVWLTLSIAVFALGSALELSAVSPAAKITWAKLSYLGVVSLAPLWLQFTLQYSQRSAWLTRTRILLLWIIPVGVLLAVFTNDWHGLVWAAITPVTPAPGARLIYTYGPVAWFHLAYAYSLLAVGTGVLIFTAWRSDQLYRRQATALIAGALLPWFGNLLYFFGLTPWPGLDLTPLAFLLTGFLIAWIGYRPRMFDLAPLARDILLNSVSDGVLVLDNQSRLVAINRVVQEWLEGNQNVLGRNVFDVLPLGREHRDLLDSPQPLHSQIEVDLSGSRQVYDLTISPLVNERGGLQGRVALLHDITRERASLDIEQRRVRQMELLNAMTHAALSTPDLQPMLETLVAPLCELLDADGAYLNLWNEMQQRSFACAAYGSFCHSLPTIPLKPGQPLVTNSLLALPLVADQQKLGMAVLAFDHPHVFSAQEIALGEQAAGQIALAVSKAQLYEGERSRNAQLMALQSVSQAITSSLDLDHIFQTVVLALRETFHYPYISIYLLEGDLLHLKAQAGYEIEPDYWHIQVSRGVMGRSVRTRQTQFVQNAAVDSDFLRAFRDVVSEICIPLIKEDTIFGVLNIESPAARPLVEADMLLLTAFASQMSVAIENARLFQAERVQREMAEALREVGLAVSESLDFETVLDRLLDEIRRVAPYDSAAVMLLDTDGRQAHITRLRGYDQFDQAVQQATRTLTFDVAATPNLRWMAQTGHSMIIADTAHDPDWIHLEVAAHVRSWAGAPIIVHEQVIGFFSLDKNEPGFYRPDHARGLEAFAGQTAIAIENARLFTEVQRLADKERRLFAATRDFTAGLDEEAVLQAIVWHMINTLDVNGCAISQWDREEDCLVTLVDYNVASTLHQDVPGRCYPLSKYPATRRVLETRQPLLVHIDDPASDPTEKALLHFYDERTVMILPLVEPREGDVFGIIELFRTDNPASFSENDLEMAQSFAAQAAAALENASLHAQVKTMAMMDGLTGLANRRAFDLSLQQEIARAGRYSYNLALIITDIDSFKLYNDAYGHPAGDERLKEIARLLRSNSRESDLVARYGGEEFAIVLPNTTRLGALNLAERIRAAAQEAAAAVDAPGIAPASPDSRAASIPGYTLSLGVAIYPTDALSPEALLLAADNAELAAKRAGKNRVCMAGISEHSREG